MPHDSEREKADGNSSVCSSGCCNVAIARHCHIECLMHVVQAKYCFASAVVTLGSSCVLRAQRCSPKHRSRLYEMYCSGGLHQKMRTTHDSCTKIMYLRDVETLYLQVFPRFRHPSVACAKIDIVTRNTRGPKLPLH